MINLTHLEESIYQACYFTESAGVLTIKNEEESSQGTLSYVEMITSGTWINLSNKILKEGSCIYQKEDRALGRISFRRDCDGICLLQLGNRKLLLIIEIKSGFNEVKKKAFEQLVASYVKTRCILQTIEGYDPADYEEMGLLISYPPSETTVITNSTSLIDIKTAAIAPTPLDKVNVSNATKLRVDQEVTLDLHDYRVDACHVNPAFFNSSLHVKYIPVTDKVSSEKINLDAII